MKHPGFGELLKIGKCFFFSLKGLLRTAGVQIPAHILGYLTGQRWGAAVISRKDGVFSGEGASCCVVF
jgi:hypothetical protein